MKIYCYSIGKNGYCTLHIIDVKDWGCDYIDFLFHSLQVLGFSAGECFVLNKKTGELSFAKSFNSLKELDKGQLNKVSNYCWGVGVEEIWVGDMSSEDVKK